MARHVVVLDVLEVGGVCVRRQRPRKRKRTRRTRSKGGNRVVEVLHPVVEVGEASTDRVDVRFEVGVVHGVEANLAKRCCQFGQHTTPKQTTHDRSEEPHIRLRKLVADDVLLLSLQEQFEPVQALEEGNDCSLVRRLLRRESRAVDSVVDGGVNPLVLRLDLGLESRRVEVDGGEFGSNLRVELRQVVSAGEVR